MNCSRSPALVLLCVGCAPLAAACGLGEGGLRGYEPDALGGGAMGDSRAGGGDAETDGASGPDSTDEAAPGDATVDRDAAGEGGPIVDAGPGADGGLADTSSDARMDMADAGGADGGCRSTCVEGGADAHPPADASTPDANGPDGGTSDGATVCDFSGTWGSRLVIDVAWTPQGVTGIILSPGSGTISQWLLSTRTPNGTGFSETAVLCGISLPDFQGTALAGSEVYGIRFPASLFDNGYIPAFAVDGTFSGKSPGSTYTSAPAAVLLGLTLSSPATTPWPATVTTDVDTDQDGHPGVTANGLSGNGYTYPPLDIFKTSRADKLYLAIRQITALSGTASDCDHVTGTVSIPTIHDSSNGTDKPAIDSHVIGCEVAGTSSTCSSTQASFVDNTQPVFTPNGGSTFTSVRMPGGTTCASVRSTLP